MSGLVVDPVRKMFRMQPPAPRPGVILDLVKFEARDDQPEFWTLRLYRDNLDSLNLSGEDALVIHNWVSDIMKNLRIIEPNIWVEIFDAMPRGVK